MAEIVTGRAPSAAELELWRRAREVAARAYARYSGLHVGAALRSPEGAVYLGVNVENASYPAGLCAERSALAAAVTAGERRFAALAVATEQNDPLLPCGACLQALGEFGELDVVVVPPDGVAGGTGAGEPRVVALSELLRAPFRSPRDLP
ncbi:MAG TPA: cytidine deaminase [Thermoleophilia bacterium]|nr:cytidine deaminase [Thermoleophilia bacterium]